LAEFTLSSESGAGDGAGVGLPPALARWADEHIVDEPGATVGSFLGWLSATVGEGDGADPADQPDAVELATFHRAKGLEWPAVALVGLEDGLVPISYATTPAARAEERRLLYVAITRAEEHLWCSWSARRPADGDSGRPRRPRRPSPFLAAVTDAGTDSPAADTVIVDRIASLRALLPVAG
ncbi:MAG: 3'-5' exonuclease, partial [Acidimicrobiales bacterium]